MYLYMISRFHLQQSSLFIGFTESRPIVNNITEEKQSTSLRKN